MINDGIINLNKPQGMTSHDCVSRMRRLLGIRRIGHTGTLDPGATGVLPICIGTAARIMEYLDLDMKAYRCTMLLGLETDTQDVWGEILDDRRQALLKAAQEGRLFDRQQAEAAFQGFSGVIEQIPPKYSAIRVAGKRLYEYARAGEEVEIKPRRVYIEDCTVNEVDLKNLSITFTVVCSKGTYIRSICRDAGAALGCGAAMSALCRLKSGIFTHAEAVTFEELENAGEEGISRYVKPADYPLVHFGRAVLSKDRARWFVNGGRIEISEARIEREPEYRKKDAALPIRQEYRDAYNFYVEDDQGRDLFLGVAFYNQIQGQFAADKVFLQGREL